MSNGAMAAAGVFGGVVLFAAWLLLSRQRRMFGGFWIWEQKRLRRDGLAAKATVLSQLKRSAPMDDGKMFTYDLVLEVTPEGKPSYRVPASITGYWYETGTQTQEGATVPVFIDRQNLQRVMIDCEQIWEAERKSRLPTAEQEARARALLDDQRRP